MKRIGATHRVEAPVECGLSWRARYVEPDETGPYRRIVPTDQAVVPSGDLRAAAPTKARELAP